MLHLPDPMNPLFTPNYSLLTTHHVLPHPHHRLLDRLRPLGRSDDDDRCDYDDPWAEDRIADIFGD